MNSIDKTEARLATHEEVCTLRYESICARLKRLESLGLGAVSVIIMFLANIAIKMN